TPYMHWPDTMMEFLVEDGVLFSCDGFAAHLCTETIWADEAGEDVDHEVWYYYDAIMRPFAGYIRRNLPKLDEFDIKVVAPSHGPLFRKEPRKYIDAYKEWTVDKAAGKKYVPIFYASNYGNTRRLAESLDAGLKRHGYDTELVNVVPLDVDRFKELLERAQAIVIGTPTFNGDAVKPIWDFLNLISTVYMIGKKAAVFGSHGWGGEGAKLVTQRLSGLKLKVLDHDLRARLIPSDEEMAGAATFADEIAAFFG
ncbi:MAG: FprA family A-type flavoprotein, partial [Candidatus Zixiibacteriota bacterium]